MRTPPASFSEDRLVGLLAEAWLFEVADLRYAPVGFGSHHWVATDPSGDRRFVTLDALDEGGTRAHFARLHSALGTAHLLRDQARLSFVVGPLPTLDGSVLSSLEPGYAVAVYPFVAGRSSRSPEGTTAEDRAAVVELLAQLHGATPTALASADLEDFDLPGRGDLERALEQLQKPWTGGPFAEGAGELLASSSARLRVMLREYDRLADEARTAGVDWVVTHGEPKADNLLVTPAGLRLVDWDTTLVAPAARDLWMVDAGAGAEVALYADLTGGRVTRDELTLYRLRWDLADVADYVHWFTIPHAHTPDTEIAWEALSWILQPDEHHP